MTEADHERTPLSSARSLGKRCEWPAAYEVLHRADAEGELGAEGLELLAECARWIGRTERVVEVLERAHRAYAGDRAGQVRTALGLCYTHMDACESSQATTWWRRADELISDLPEGPEHGLHAWFAGRARGDEGDLDGHEEHARRALDIGRRFGDRNVEALALMDLAHVATARGDSRRGSEMLDDATALAVGGEIGMLETGLVYCNAIITCRSRGEWDQAQEWTSSASRWVERVRVSYFPGLCRVHRAEVLRVRGELEAAESEALEAIRLLSAAVPRWLALAYIELGEIRRRRGDLKGSFGAYRLALSAGWDPQPGLALLVLAQGDAPAAHAALERFASSPAPTLACEDRLGLLRARLTVAIAAGELAIAEAMQVELAASIGDSAWERAAHAHAQGELALANESDAAAIERLHLARTAWSELDAPYELATACVLLGKALARTGDALGATLELEAACGVFERIGAELDGRIAKELLETFADIGEREVDRSSSLEPRNGEGRLRREGELWSISLDGSSVPLRDSRGLTYLAQLLAAPGREHFSIELSGGTAPTDDAGELLDPEARRAYRERIGELRATLDEAERDNDIGTAERCRAELDELTSHLARAVGLGGRIRRAGDPNERARQSVTKALVRTIRKIAEADERLGRHLSNTVRTGITCRYEPDPGRPVIWFVDA